jgi:hypothetical protein
VRALWDGLAGRGNWRDLSWIVPLAVAFTAVCVAVAAVTAV